MTVPVINPQPSITYTVVENGVYELPFDALDNADNLQAWYRDGNDVPQDLQFGTDLIINFGSGYGTIFLVKDLAIGDKFTVVRKVQNDQSKTFKSTQLFSSQIEDSLDKLTILAQDNSFEDTCLRATTDETITDDTKLELPAGQNRIYTALTIDKEGEVSTLPLRNIGVKIPATKSDLGFVIPGGKLSLEESGLIDVPPADNDTLGVVKIGEEISISDGTISFSVPGNILQDISDAETNISNVNTFLQDIPTNIASVEGIASTAQTKVQEKVVSCLKSNIGDVWVTTGIGVSQTFQGAIMASNRIIAFGSKVYYSDDEGDTWTPATTHPGSTLYGAVQIGSRIVAVGSSCAAYSDDNGANWTTVTTGLSSIVLYGVTKLGTRLIAVGYPSKAFYSDDFGESWTLATVSGGGSRRYRCPVVTGNRVAAIYQNPIYSDDGGVTWSQSNILTGSVGDLTGLKVGSGIVSIGFGGKTGLSDDGGRTWVGTPSSTHVSGDFYGLVQVGNRLVAVGGATNKAAYSDDFGQHWTAATTPPTGTCYGLVRTKHRLVAVGSGNAQTNMAYCNITEQITVPEAINRILEQKGV